MHDSHSFDLELMLTTSGENVKVCDALIASDIIFFSAVRICAHAHTHVGLLYRGAGAGSRAHNMRRSEKNYSRGKARVCFVRCCGYGCGNMEVVGGHGSRFLMPVRMKEKGLEVHLRLDV